MGTDVGKRLRHEFHEFNCLAGGASVPAGRLNLGLTTAREDTRPTSVAFIRVRRCPSVVKISGED